MPLRPALQAYGHAEDIVDAEFSGNRMHDMARIRHVRVVPRLAAEGAELGFLWFGHQSNMTPRVIDFKP
jgi:hypothetical protein